MKIKVIGISIALLLLVCCEQKRDPHTPKVVAIATLMSHPALDEVIGGAKEALAEDGWIEGQNVEFLERNANQQVPLAAAIATEVAAQRPDIIIAVTTPMAQAMKRVATGPLVFAAVTDPVGAGLVEDISKGSDLITGTSDAWPYKDQIALIREILPNCRRLGILYNPGEAASQYGIIQIRKFAPELGFELVEVGVNSVGEVRPAAESLVGRVDALFLSSDNTVIGGMVGALRTAIAYKRPLFVGDSGTVERGGLAAVSVGYHELGRMTGALASRMLRGERNIPTVVAKGNEIFLNQKSAELLGVHFSDSLIARAFRIYDSISQ